ncbi:arabinose efflux permease [Vibrio ponticus]|nr:arabinose efflux permease [Vibrio ponticus]
MANPEYQETLDTLDKLSVCLYRTGISVFSLALIGLATTLSGLVPIDWLPMTLLVTCVATAMSAANLHVYNKLVRTIIVWVAWIGILLMLSDGQQSNIWLSLGFLFITFSGIALKESFCFKVMGLKLVPLLLASTVLLLWLDLTLYAAVLMMVASLIMGYLSYQKWRMPLHFDIGIKANYEV